MRLTPFRPGLVGFICWLGLATTGLAQRPQFDVRRDYAYDLSATSAAIVDVELTTDGLAWPAELPPGDTAFLEITLAATTGDAPEIRVVRGNVVVRQVFEPGAQGRRFIDVSPLLAATGSRAALTGMGASWRTTTARLFLYKNAPLDGRRVLVLAPHPDDAEIAAFGLYSRTRADVVTVTAGDAGGDNFKELFPDPPEHYRVKGWIRTWNSISVPFYGGIPPGQARNLGYYDARLRTMHAKPVDAVSPLLAKLDDPAYYRRFNVDAPLRDRPFKATWQALVDDLGWELRRVKPAVIVAPHPLLDAHGDHQFTTIALIEALAKWEGECELYLYTNHALENEAWPLGDRQAMSGLPPSSRADLFFRGIYSHPLTSDEQKFKRIALESMHDLRAFDLRDGTPAREAEHRPWKPSDYHRRGPRPNELFFVLSREDAFRLRDAFLSTR